MIPFSAKKINRTFSFLLLLVSLFLLFSLGVFDKKNNPERVVFLDVGQGDSVLIQTSTGKNILVDTGAYGGVEEKIDSYVSFLDRKIDLLIITHPDLDHFGGMATLLDSYDVKNIAYSQAELGSDDYRVLQEKAKRKNIATRILSAGDVISFSKSEEIKILYPADNFVSTESNEYSLVVQYVSPAGKVLLTGDALLKNEIDIYRSYRDSLQSDILKLGHHGSKTSSSLVFLEYVKPLFSIVSAECNSRFGHPHQNTVEKALSVGSKILDTCSYSDIVFEPSEEGGFALVNAM